jgi:hypothetical protein
VRPNNSGVLAGRGAETEPSNHRVDAAVALADYCPIGEAFTILNLRTQR